MSTHKTKSAILIYATILCVLCALPISIEDVGLYKGAGWLHHLTYQHFHGSVFHLLCNIWALLVYAFAVGTPWHKFLIAYVLSATYPFAGTDIIVGVSGLVYALAGMYSFWPVAARFFLRYHLFFAATIAIGALFSHVAVGIHVYCYLIGAVYAFWFLPIRTTAIHNKMVSIFKMA